LKIAISPYYHSWQKRLFDVMTAGTGLILLWPMFIVIAVVIIATAGSPIFFLQKRMGRDQKPFTLIKFRTMLVNAEKKRGALLKKNEAPWPMFKLHSDPRYTKIGKFLSRTGLDELPQLINILKGEMSLVGPRPLPLYEAKKLPKSWSFRYQVKPGIISEWAINNRRYHSLKMWKKLEVETLQARTSMDDLHLISRTIQYLLHSVV
jgi:lipopolysaccharide/colanic/teichoic acid biosynthesis glycosyltransferase